VLAAEIDRLNSDLFSGGKAPAVWPGQPLEKELVKARKSFLKSRTRRGEPTLPPLNPFGNSEALS
jgi:hypothetical protein